MRWVQGVVHVPLKHVYLVIVVLATAYFIAREITSANRRRRQDLCAAFEAGQRQDMQHPRRAVGGDPREVKEDDLVEDTEPSAQCLRPPVQTDPEYCSECMRPQAHVISRQLQTVSDSILKFPRGPSQLFQPRARKQQKFVGDYLIEPWAVCRPDMRCPFLLAVQLSIARDAETRKAVRTTWGSVAKTKLWPHSHVNGEVQLLFVLGHPVAGKGKINRPDQGNSLASDRVDPAKHRWTQLTDENAAHGDLLYLDMQDTYFNLTLKLMSAFKWVRDHCGALKFVLKVDSDTFVNIPLLIDLLLVNEKRLDYSVVGTIYTHEKTVYRAGKWTVNDSLYPPPVFPVYASGCNYILSAGVLVQLVDTAPYVPLDHRSTFLGPDYFATGIMGSMLGFEFFHVPGTDLFASCNGSNWKVCDLVSDHRVFCAVPHTPGNSSRLAKIWRAFFRFYGHYR